MPQIVLDPPRVFAFGGEKVAAGVAEHMSMNSTLWEHLLPKTLDHAREAHRRPWASSLGEEDVANSGSLALLQCSERTKDVTAEVVGAVLSSFDPPHQDCPTGEVDVAPFQIHELRGSQPMPPCHANGEPIPLGPSVAFSSLLQEGELSLREVVIVALPRLFNFRPLGHLADGRPSPCHNCAKLKDCSTIAHYLNSVNG